MVGDEAKSQKNKKLKDQVWGLCRGKGALPFLWEISLLWWGSECGSGTPAHPTVTRRGLRACKGLTRKSSGCQTGTKALDSGKWGGFRGTAQLTQCFQAPGVPAPWFSDTVVAVTFGTSAPELEGWEKARVTSKELCAQGSLDNSLVLEETGDREGWRVGY